MPNGWFAIEGMQHGARSVEEQLQGLAPALAVASGKTVYDFGSAEGLIALEFVKFGAASVRGFDNNAVFLHAAHQVRARLPAAQQGRVRFEPCDLRETGAIRQLPARDLVLALAILHKLADPEASARAMAALARERLVVRLPLGSEGVVQYKHGKARCDLRAVLPECGLTLEQTLPGPRGEWVQHWIRKDLVGNP
jgi:hypothetical protein